MRSSWVTLESSWVTLGSSWVTKGSSGVILGHPGRAIYKVGKPSNLLAYFFRFLGPNCAQKLIVSHSASRQATQRQMARLLTNQPYKLALRQEIIMEFMRTELK